MTSSARLRLFLALAIAMAGLAFAPAGASAHRLSARDALSTARKGCRLIDQSPRTPYRCRGVLSGRRISAHAFIFQLDVFDPNDGEECIASVRTSIRAGSRRIRGTIGRGDCEITPRV
jgi:hypothetical protein